MRLKQKSKVLLIIIYLLNGSYFTPVYCSIPLKHDSFNVIMANQGSLEGSIFCNQTKNKVSVEKEDQADSRAERMAQNNNLVYGFTSINDKITWIVNAPQAANYMIAFQYATKKFQNIDPNCEIEVEINGKSLKSNISKLLYLEDFEKIAGTRQWFDGTLLLKKGENKISLHFSKISELQIEYAKSELKKGLPAKASQSISIRDINLVCPEVWKAMKSRAQKLKPDLSWMRNGKYGLFTHWSLLTYPLYGNKKASENFEWGVNIFDVEAYADMVQETGASWVIFTTCHGMNMFPAPIKTLDDVLPGRTSKRDLIADLAKALNKRNIKLLLYYNLCPGDKVAQLLESDKDPSKYFKFLIDFAKEVSLRYGKTIAGWGYIDNTTSAYDLNMPWEEYYMALKAGNPNAVVGISCHWWAEFTPFNDLQTADCGASLKGPLNVKLYNKGERYEGLQQHFSFVLEGSWVPREPYNGIIRSNSKVAEGPKLSDQEYIAYFKKMADAHIPITVNMLITQDVTSKQPFVNPKSLELMKKIKIALNK